MNGNHIQQQAADQSLADGLTKNASRIPSLLIDGRSYTVAEVVQIVMGRVSASKAVDANHGLWLNAVKANKAQRAATRVFMTQLRQALQVMFASAVDILGDMGLTPRKQPQVKVAVKAEAALKAKATRTARGTKGKRQKAAIKGTVPTPPATATPPVAAPTPPAPSPTTPAAAPATPAKQ
jgi:hypothetical protein